MARRATSARSSASAPSTARTSTPASPRRPNTCSRARSRPPGCAKTCETPVNRSPDPLADTLRVALEIAREAGRILLEGWGTRPAVGFKSEDINLVTEYDRRSEALIVDRLSRAFPEDRVVAEEG